MSKFIAFVQPKGPTIFEPIEEAQDLTSSELLQVFGFESGNIVLHHPLYLVPLEKDAKPIQEHSELILDDAGDLYDHPDYYLTMDPYDNFIAISVQPKVKKGFEIPSFFVRLLKSELEKGSFEYVKNEIERQIKIKINSSKIYFEQDQFIELSENSLEIVERAKKQQLYVDFSFSDMGIAQIRGRTHTLSEILSTEKTYNNDLNLIRENWRDGLKDLFIPEDFELIFKDVDKIYTVHQQFLNDLIAEGTLYGARFALPFLKLAQVFKVSMDYVTNFPIVLERLNNYEKNKPFIAAVNEIAKNLDDRDLRSFLVTPVQRMPRYSLFLKELIRNTFSSHPDYDLLHLASKYIDHMTKKIEKKAAHVKQQLELQKLQENINNFIFLDKPRDLVHKVAVRINNKKTGEIYVFEDLIMFLQSGKKVVFDSPVQVFPHRPLHPNELSLTVDTSEKDYVKKSSYFVTFNSPEEMKTFYEEVSKLQKKLIFNLGTTNHVLEWESYPLERALPQLVSPNLATYDDSLIIVSNHQTNPQLLRVALSNNNVFQTKVKFPIEMKTPNTLSNRHNIMYIVNDGNIIKYDPKMNKTSVLESTFSPRSGHTSVFWHDELVIFGGKTLDSDSRLLNELIICNVAKDTIRVVEPTEDTPSPRWCHCSFLWKHHLYIFGGETEDGSIDDHLYRYNLRNGRWDELYTKGLIPRKGGRAVVKNHYATFIGGSPGGGPQLFNLNTNKVISVENFGNFPSQLVNFDALFVTDGSLIVASETNLYKVNTPATLKKSVSSARFDPEALTEGDSVIMKRKKRKIKKFNYEPIVGGSLRRPKLKRKSKMSSSVALFNIEEENDFPINEQETRLIGKRDEIGTPQPYSRNVFVTPKSNRRRNQRGSPTKSQSYLLKFSDEYESDNEEGNLNLDGSISPIRCPAQLEICTASPDVVESGEPGKEKRYTIISEDKEEKSHVLSIIAAAAISALVTTGAISFYFRNRRH